MADAKVFVTVPEDVLACVDAAAKEQGESRSRFISRVLRSAIKARSDAELTRRLDEIFADRAVAAQQLRVAKEMNSAGTDWSDETW